MRARRFCITPGGDLHLDHWIADAAGWCARVVLELSPCPPFASG